MRKLPWLVLLPVAAVACRAEAPCPECGAAVISAGADADLLLPALTQGVGRQVSDQIFLKLADVGLARNTVGDSGFVPRLAEAWQFESPRTLVFHLNPGARWQDGAPVTAADVAFTFAAYTDTLLDASVRPLLEDIDSVTARDERTAVFHFRRTYPEEFFDATHHMRILPQHLLDSVPRDRWRTHPFARPPLGDGPYHLVSWRPGESIELAADSTFFQGPPGISRLIWHIAPDFNAAITQLIAGEADIIENVIGSENIERVRQDSSLRLVEYPAGVYMYLGFNLRDPKDQDRPNALLGNRALRRALTLAIDRQALVQAVLGGYGTVPPGPTTPMVWIAQGAPRQLPFDSAAAGRLLDSLGWRRVMPDSIRTRAGRRLAFEVLYPSSSGIRQRAGVIIQEQLRRAGAEIKLTPIELNVWIDRARTGKFDAIIGAWQIDLPPSGLRELWGGGGIGAANYDHYSSPVFDSLIARAGAAGDPTEARRLWHQALDTINQDAPAVWLFSPTMFAGLSRRIENVTIRPDEWWATLWTWRAGRRGGS